MKIRVKAASNSDEISLAIKHIANSKEVESALVYALIAINACRDKELVSSFMKLVDILDKKGIDYEVSKRIPNGNNVSGYCFITLDSKYENIIKKKFGKLYINNNSGKLAVGISGSVFWKYAKEIKNKIYSKL